MRWSGNMLFRKLIRTIGKYKAQFISMIVMIALGAGVFVGFNIEWYSLGKDGNAFFDQLNYADYRVYSETGFSEEDVEAIRKIDGVENATRYLSVNTTVKGQIRGGKRHCYWGYCDRCVSGCRDQRGG